MIPIIIFAALSLSFAGKTDGHGHGQLFSAQPRFGWEETPGYICRIIRFIKLCSQNNCFRIWASPPSKKLFWFVKSKAEPQPPL